jgi:multiple sugar transport system substrate-binding protein
MLNQKKHTALALILVVMLIVGLAPIRAQDVVELNWRTRPGDEAEQATYQAVNDRINESFDNIELTYDPAPYQGYEDKLLTELSSGSAPNIVWVPGATFSSYASKGVFVDLMPLIEADSNIAVEDFFPVVMDEIEHDGTLFGLPRDVGTMVVYYNVDMFEAAGLQTPQELQAEGNWNWETMYEASLALTNDTESADEVTWGLDIPFWWPTYLNVVQQAGGSLFNEDRTACALNSEATLEAFEFLYKLYNGDDENPAVAPVPGSSTDAANLFMDGKIGMHWDGRWATSSMRAMATMNWDVVELPEGPAGPSNFAFWGAYAITKSTDDVDAAFTVLKELVSSETQNSIIELGTIMPSIVSQDSLDAFVASSPPENNMAFLNPLEYAVPEQSPWNINMNLVLWAVLHPEAQRVMVGEISPEEFTNTVCDQIDPNFE